MQRTRQYFLRLLYLTILEFANRSENMEYKSKDTIDKQHTHKIRTTKQRGHTYTVREKQPDNK